jgi:surface antigen
MPGRLSVVTAVVLLGAAAGGCSFSYKLEGFSATESAKADQTASLKLPSAPTNAKSANATSGRLPPEGDLALAKAAVHDLLARGGQQTSLPWENPRTGARGTVTPIADAYTQDGFTCRDFLASYVREGSESWMQGEACRVHHGKWEVKAIRPLSRT